MFTFINSFPYPEPVSSQKVIKIHAGQLQPVVITPSHREKYIQTYIKHVGVYRVMLTRLQKLRLWLDGYIYIGDRKLPGWRQPQPFYAFKCPVHGTVYNYPQGYGQTLKCPQCINDKLIYTNLCPGA